MRVKSSHPVIKIKKIILVLLLTFLFIPSLFADELQIPFSCWPEELQIAFIHRGRKLDLSPNERTWDSWGYLVNEGSRFKIYTYKPATTDDLNIIRNIVFKIEADKLKEQDG